jgi:alkylation response protein AidB-like acyl-CoA dehydrogenase
LCISRDLPFAQKRFCGAEGLENVINLSDFKDGGFGKNFATSMLTTEILGAGHSFAVAIAAHTGIGTLPILLYGNEEQKQKYIPKLATGEFKGCYCLTEPSAGSDANSGKSKAVLSPE